MGCIVVSGKTDTSAFVLRYLELCIAARVVA
jgi:hypothetical protein